MIYECQIYCHANGTDEAEAMGLEGEEVLRDGFILLGEVFSANRDETRGEGDSTIVYLKHEPGGISIDVPYAEFMSDYQEWYEGQGILPSN